jgi:hypothetical protein
VTGARVAVIDPQSAKINPYQASNGISVGEVADCLRTIGGRFPIVGATVSAYDPDSDPEGSGAAGHGCGSVRSALY